MPHLTESPTKSNTVAAQLPLSSPLKPLLHPAPYPPTNTNTSPPPPIPSLLYNTISLASTRTSTMTPTRSTAKSYQYLPTTLSTPTPEITAILTWVLQLYIITMIRQLSHQYLVQLDIAPFTPTIHCLIILQLIYVHSFTNHPPTRFPKAL